MEEIVAETKCRKPCHYREYRRVGEPRRMFQFEAENKGLKLWVVSRELATEVAILLRCRQFEHYHWLQVLIYEWSSLIAEFGGTLGLFLGFSFMTLWDGIVFLKTIISWIKDAVKKLKKPQKIYVKVVITGRSLSI